MTNFINKRVLVVEDNGPIAIMIGEMMKEFGAWPIGPATTEAEAFDIIDYAHRTFDAAILDLRLDRSSADVAAKLHELGIPFIFATGLPHEVPARFSHVPTCAKPYTIADLQNALHRAFEVSLPAAPNELSQGLRPTI